jgi:hypothetical protein
MGYIYIKKKKKHKFIQIIYIYLKWVEETDSIVVLKVYSPYKQYLKLVY